jgi:hypothetical protein
MLPAVVAGELLMKILVLADVESKYLWDYFEKEKLEARFGKDGSLLKGEGWIDTYIPNFYDFTREKQIEALFTTPIFDLNASQAEYVVDKILN